MPVVVSRRRGPQKIGELDAAARGGSRPGVAAQGDAGGEARNGGSAADGLTTGGQQLDAETRVGSGQVDSQIAGEPAVDMELASVCALAQALGAREATAPVLLVVACRNVWEVTGDETPRPRRAALLAAALAAARQVPGVDARACDLGHAGQGDGAARLDGLAELLVEDLDGISSALPPRGSRGAVEPAQLPGHPEHSKESGWGPLRAAAPSAHHLVAYRGRYRWVHALEPVAEESAAPGSLRAGGRYLIAGPLAGPAGDVAGYLARELGATLILVGSGAGADRLPDDRVERIAASGPAEVEAELRRRRERGERFDGVIVSVEAPSAGARADAPADTQALWAAVAAGARLVETAWSVPPAIGAGFLLLSSFPADGDPGAAASAALCELFARTRRVRGGPLLTAIAWEGSGGPAAANVAAFQRALAVSRPQVVVRSRTLTAAISSPVLAGEPTLLAAPAAAPADGVAAAGRPVAASASPVAPARPAHRRRNLRTPYVAPSNDLEQEVAESWEAFLGIAGIGVHDALHDLGGHSLMATQMLSQVHDRFGVSLSLADFFEEPTVAALAAAIARLRSAASQAALAPEAGAADPADSATAAATTVFEPSRIAPLPRDGRPLPLSFAQERLWFLDQWETGTAAYNIASLVRLDGVLDLPALAASAPRSSRRHEGLRTTFAESTGGRTRWSPLRLLPPCL